MDTTTLYWLAVLPSVGETLHILSTILFSGAALIAAASTIAACTEYNEEVKEKSKTLAKGSSKIAAVAAATLVLVSFIPSEKQMYMIAGGYVATNAEGIEKLPDNLSKAANAWLERLAEESIEKVTNDDK